jgi:predicted Ser/Thr protein kinase
MSRGPLLPGDPERIGAYQLEARLGQGGQGAVFLGRDRAGRPVAVKVLHPEFLEDPSARRRFGLELAAVRRVARFCVAQVVDADTDGDRPYIVSEFVDGVSLQQLVSGSGPRHGAELDRLAIGTATALTAIHEAGVVHCDFKPSNVLIAADGPRVIDFGIARALDTSGAASQVIGTPSYMAPEQFELAAAHPPVDVFAWGATMAFAVNRASPFAAESGPATMYRVMQSPPNLGGLDGPLRELVQECLAKNPADRPTSRDLLLALVGAREVRPSPAMTTPGGDPDGDLPTRQILGLGAARADAHAGPVPDAETELSPDPVTGRPRSTKELPDGRRRRRVLVGAGALVLVAAAVAATLTLWPRDSAATAPPAAPPAAAPAETFTSIPEVFAGTWSGHGALPGEGTEVNPSVLLTTGSRHAEIGAGESACASGSLDFRSATTTELQMDLRSGDGCPDGTLFFDLTGDGKISMHLGPEQGTTYYATLTR